jgi:DNA-binding PadR family transcriptional regulator
MARGRKSSKVKVITGRDRDLMMQLSKTGLCNSMQAKKHCGVSMERLKKLEKSGYIKTSEHIVRGENNLIVQLDKGGREYCRQEFGTLSFCAAQKNHLEHDIKLTEIYYKLDSDVQDTWRHEGELIRQYHEMYPDKSEELKTCIDAAVEVNGELIAIESLGASYTGAEIQLKQEIAVSLGCSRMECA